MLINPDTQALIKLTQPSYEKALAEAAASKGPR
jgi:hypothetical protein